jgi:hypothetical protein
MKAKAINREKSESILKEAKVLRGPKRQEMSKRVITFV